MDLAALRAEFRTRTDDLVAPFLWEDVDVDRYANDAEKEACERAYLIEEQDNDNVCLIDAVGGTGTYALHPSVIKVRSVTWDGRFLQGIARETLDERHPKGWNTLTGNPCEFIDPQEHFLTLYRIPTVNGTVRLNVYRRQMALMADGSDSPEIHERYHLMLVDWMEHLAYGKRDADSYNAKLAAEKEAAFTASFGIRPTADQRRKQRARRSNMVRFNPSW